MTEVLAHKLHNGKPGGPHVRHCILRMPGVLDVSSRSLVGQYGDFGEQTSGAPEMMCGRCWGNTRFLSRRTQGIIVKATYEAYEATDEGGTGRAPGVGGNNLPYWMCRCGRIRLSSGGKLFIWPGSIGLPR